MSGAKWYSKNLPFICQVKHAGQAMGMFNCDMARRNLPPLVYPLGDNSLKKSQITMPAVTDTLRECLVPYCGISMQPCDAPTTSC